MNFFREIKWLLLMFGGVNLVLLLFCLFGKAHLSDLLYSVCLDAAIVGIIYVLYRKKLFG